jgi:hypothetical protein
LGTVSGACVGPASLKLELVGATSPVAAGQVITIKATPSQANADVSGKAVTFSVSPFTCTGTAATDALGSAVLTCTVPALLPPVVNQAATPPGSITINAVATPGTGPPVAAPALTVSVAAALCGALTGTSTTLYFEGFTAGVAPGPNSITATPSGSLGIVTPAAGAFGAFEGAVLPQQGYVQGSPMPFYPSDVWQMQINMLPRHAVLQCARHAEGWLGRVDRQAHDVQAPHGLHASGHQHCILLSLVLQCGMLP